MPETIPQLVDQELDELIRSAIMQRNLLRFTYKSNERIAEPHDYGIQNGIVRVFCSQVAGRSTSPLPGWCLVDVHEMQDYEILEQHFAGNREAPSGRHHRWDGLHPGRTACELEGEASEIILF